MHAQATPADIERVCAEVRALGMTPQPLAGATRTAVAITGNTGPVPAARLARLPGVLEVVPITSPLRLAAREVHAEPTIVHVGEHAIGGKSLVVIAGPCAVESEEQTLTVARAVQTAGAALLRGGAFKPRTSPYTFQGLGVEGLRILAQARARTGLPVVTEAIDAESLGLVAEYADMVQIGARNMQNFALLRAAGRCGKPVLLKRGPSATLDEWLMAAEYVMHEGNGQVELCERGVRGFGDHARHTLDLSVVPAAKARTHLPIVVDPSHGTGRHELVPALARAAIAAGADGVMVEVHHAPATALSDGAQALVPEEFTALMVALRQIAPIVEREL